MQKKRVQICVGLRTCAQPWVCVCGCENMRAVPFSQPSARVSSSWGEGLSLQGSLGTFRNVGEMDWERLLLLLWLLPAAVPRGVCVSMLRELALRWQRGGGARCPSGASWGWAEKKCNDYKQQKQNFSYTHTHTASSGILWGHPIM